MSIDVVIRQRGLFGKPLPLDVMIGDGLLFGCYDADMRMQVGAMDGGELVMYDPHRVGRGFSVCWTVGERRMVSMRALTPTTDEELRCFVKAAARVASYWRTQVETDGRRMRPEAFLAETDDIIAANRRALEGMASRIASGESEAVSLCCVRWPLVVGVPEAKCILDEPGFFGDWLHGRQMVRAERARVAHSGDPDDTLGVVTVREGEALILPVTPSLPGEEDVPEASRSGQGGRAVMRLCSENVIGEGEYAELLGRLPRSKVTRYDAGSLMVQPLSTAEMEKMLAK